MLVPIPPIVTSFPMRAGWWMAKLIPTPPPIELPTISTESSSSASRNGATTPCAVIIGCPPKSSVTPKPGNSRIRQRKFSEKVGNTPRKLRQPVTPGPEPCRNSTVGPLPWS